MANEVNQQLLYKNLKLLTANYNGSRELKDLLRKDMFTVPNKSAFEHVICFLLNILQNKKYASRIILPIIDKKHEVDFHNAIYCFIKEIRLEFPEARLPTFAQSALKSPGGKLIVKILLNISTFVMITCLKRDYEVDDLILYPRMNSNLNALSCVHDAQFCRNALNMKTMRQRIGDVLSEMTSHKLYLTTLLNEKHKYMLTILEDKLICPVMKARLLDLNNFAVITDLNNNERWKTIKELVTKLVQYEQHVECLYNTVLTTENMYKSPIFLDGSALCVPPLSDDLDPHLKMLILSYHEDEIVELQKCLEIIKHCLMLKGHEMNTATLEDVSHIPSYLTVLALKYQEIESSIQSTCTLLEEQHDQLVQDDDSIAVVSEGVHLPFKATPRMALLDREFTSENYDPALNVCITPVGSSHNHKMYDTRCGSVNMQSVAGLMSKQKSVVNQCISTTASSKKQGTEDVNDIASVRKRMSVLRRDLQLSVSQSHVQYAELSLTDNVPTVPTKQSCIARNVGNTNNTFEGTLQKVGDSSAKKSPLFSHKKAPSHSQFVMNAAVKRNKSHDRMTIPPKPTRGSVPDDKILEEMVQQMLQKVASVEEESISEDENVFAFSKDSSEMGSCFEGRTTDFSGIKALASSSFNSSLDSPFPRHCMYQALNVAMSPDPKSHPIFEKEFSFESSNNSSCHNTSIDQVENLDLSQNFASPIAKSENSHTTPSDPESVPSGSTRQQKHSNRKSLDFIIEKFQRIKKNMKQT